MNSATKINIVVPHRSAEAVRRAEALADGAWLRGAKTRVWTMSSAPGASTPMVNAIRDGDILIVGTDPVTGAVPSAFLQLADTLFTSAGRASQTLRLVGTFPLTFLERDELAGDFDVCAWTMATGLTWAEPGGAEADAPADPAAAARLYGERLTQFAADQPQAEASPLAHAA
ncbi:MAG: hypothetical protein WBA67_05665 [Jannaschia sp.]